MEKHKDTSMTSPTICYLESYLLIFKYQGPVVQSNVSLTSSLRGPLLSVLQLYTLIFIVAKMREAFALQKLLTFFNQKYWRKSDINF